VFNRLVLILGSILVSACGSSSGDDSNPDLLPAINSPNVPRHEVPLTTNGFYLTSETVMREFDTVVSKVEYELDAGSSTILQFGISESGERVLEGKFGYNEDSLITSEEVVQEIGDIGQSFTHLYDSQRRVVTSSLFISDEPFLTTDYFFNDVGAPYKNVVRATEDEVEFSTTTFQYDNERILTSSILRTPSQLADIRKIYTYTTDGSQLLAVDEEGERKCYT